MTDSFKRMKLSRLLIALKEPDVSQAAPCQAPPRPAPRPTTMFNDIDYVVLRYSIDNLQQKIRIMERRIRTLESKSWGK